MAQHWALISRWGRRVHLCPIKVHPTLPATPSQRTWLACVHIQPLPEGSLAAGTTCDQWRAVSKTAGQGVVHLEWPGQHCWTNEQAGATFCYPRPPSPECHSDSKFPAAQKKWCPQCLRTAASHTAAQFRGTPPRQGSQMACLKTSLLARPFWVLFLQHWWPVSTERCASASLVSLNWGLLLHSTAPSPHSGVNSTPNSIASHHRHKERMRKWK